MAAGKPETVEYRFDNLVLPQERALEMLSNMVKLGNRGSIDGTSTPVGYRHVHIYDEGLGPFYTVSDYAAKSDTHIASRTFSHGDLLKL